MSSFHQREARISEPYPCPDCGADAMITVNENCVLSDGLKVKKLKHLKCTACGKRYFDDEAMHKIQYQRAESSVTVK